jgi:hypothetical protein
MDAKMAEKHPIEAEADDHDSIEERAKGEHVAVVVGLFDENVRVTNTVQISIEQSLAESEKAAARDTTGALWVRAIVDGGIDWTSGPPSTRSPGAAASRYTPASPALARRRCSNP